MTALSLADMELAGHAHADGPQLVIRVPTEWPAEGEKRIGYVSIMRLAELTRELHWRRDIAPHADMMRIDTTTRTVSGDFARPIIADTNVRCSYALTWLRSRSYGLRVTLSAEGGDPLAYVDLTNVFIDPRTMRPVVPDDPITAALRIGWRQTNSAEPTLSADSDCI